MLVNKAGGNYVDKKTNKQTLDMALPIHATKRGITVVGHAIQDGDDDDNGNYSTETKHVD